VSGQGRVDQVVVCNPAFLREMPPDMAINVGGGAVNRDDCPIGQASNNMRAETRCISNVGTARDINANSRTWQVAGILRADNVKEVPGRLIYVQERPAT